MTNSEYHSITDDVLLLYELSLSIGKSLDLTMNCQEFINTLMSRKNLDFASVWIKNDYLSDDTSREGYRRYYAIPNYNHNSVHIPLANPIIEKLATQDIICYNTEVPADKPNIVDKSLGKGSYAFFRLGDIGFLMLFTSEAGDRLCEKKVNQLKAVVGKFEHAIEGCLAHQKVQQKIEESAKAEEELKSVALFPEENPNPILRIAHSGEIMYFNRASEYLVEHLDLTLGGMLPVVLFKQILMALMGRDSNEIEVSVNDRYFTFELISMKESDYINIYARDITSKKKAQSALVQSEARYRQLVEVANDIIYTIDNDGYFTYVNPVASHKMGMNEKEIIGRHFTELVRKDRVKELVGFYKNQLTKKLSATYLEFPAVTYDGREIWLGQNVQAIEEDNKIVGFTAVARDISDRVKTQELLKRSEEKYRGIIENMKLGLLEVDLEEKIKYANQSFCQITGYDLKELIGKKASDIFLPNHTPSKGELLKQNESRQKGQSSVYEIKLNRKGGKEIWAMISGAPVYDEYGSVKGSVGIHVDITERKDYETEIKKALKKEKELNELKSRFVSMTSHEFRTPLTTIQTNAELIAFQLEGLELQNKPRLERNIERISSEIHRLVNLMNDILVLGKLESGKIRFEPISTDLEQLCNEVIDESFSNETDGRKVEFAVQGRRQDINIDPNIFSHIITNLLANSFKYSKGKSNPRLCLNYQAKGVQLRFIDEGIGIPAEEQSQLFDSFFRATNVSNLPGTGLGLSIVKQFVEMHKGSISLTSEVNHGTEFKIIIPQIKPPEEKPKSVKSKTKVKVMV
ncbi:MAG: PAS domain-containing sensor histidine kinase [Bacteroidota bacterium]